jgi:adenylate cyclase
MSPNLASAHGELGAALMLSGRASEGIAALKTSIRLDPHSPRLAQRLTWIIMGHYFSNEYETAVEEAKKSIRSFPDYPPPYRWLAASLGQLGRSKAANRMLNQAISINPALFKMYVRTRPPWFRPEDHAHMLEGLRKAGMPEE